MKPFVYRTALVLALLLLFVALSAWIEVLTHGDFFSHPLVKSAAGWSMTGLMFLAVGWRGWRSRKKSGKEAKTTESPP